MLGVKVGVGDVWINGQYRRRRPGRDSKNLNSLWAPFRDSIPLAQDTMQTVSMQTL